MVSGKIFFIVFLLLISIFSLCLVSAGYFVINGTIADNVGNVLNNTNISIVVKNFTSWAQVAECSNITNESGWFTLSVNSSFDYGYQMTMVRTNLSLNFVDWVGKTLPLFPYAQFSQLTNVNYYLDPAATLNITALNRTNTNISSSNFAVQLKDTKMGYPVGSCSGRGNQYICYVPRARNYSVLIYPSDGSPENFVPVSFNWNNFTSNAVYNVTDNLGANLSYYNGTTRTLHKRFNVTESFARITGYANGSSSNIYGWTNLTVVPFLLEPGNMISMTRGTLPFNVSAWRNQSDNYTLSTGWFNISLPYVPAETVSYMLFAAASNGTCFGNFQNITVSGNININLTMYGLLGSNSTISQNNATGGTRSAFTKRQVFTLVNSSDNISLSSLAFHTEVKVDYSNYGSKEFTFVDDGTGQGVANFSLPLLNVTGIKEINVYTSTYSPKRVPTKTSADIISNNNISMKLFSPTAVSGSLTGTTTISAYRSNSSCDVPNPNSNCLLVSFAQGSSESMQRMFGLVVGGGLISLRMSYGGIAVHYVNVDLLASGPPDADFDSSANSSTSGSFVSTAKFGSSGPTIYDYVLTSMPYTEGSSSTTGLNESAPINLSISTFYEDNWNTPIWNVSNGTNASAFAGNNSHFSTYQAQWQVLMAGTFCVTNVSTLNSSSPCYLDTANDKIWMRLPHFSGTQPSYIGGVITATSSDDDGSSSSPTTETSYWTWTREISDTLFAEGFNEQLFLKNRVLVKVNNETHSVGVVAINSESATINISSTPQQAIFYPGDEKKFDVTNDNYYDLLIKLNNIVSNGANLTIKKIYEKIPVASLTSLNDTTSINNQDETKEGSSKIIWFIVIPIIILAVAGYFIYQFYKKKRYYSRGV